MREQGEGNAEVFVCDKSRKRVKREEDRWTETSEFSTNLLIYMPSAEC